MKIAVIIATYYRIDNSSKQKLRRMFRCLKAQSYKNFKVFIVGDNYTKRQEFTQLCKKYRSPTTPIFFDNNKSSLREGYFNKKINLWTSGGILARHKALKQAIKEQYDIYLHLDDDDIWLSNHVANYVNIFKQYPTIDFVFSRAEYKNFFLPKNIPTNIKIYKNNLHQKIKPGGIVHSTFGFNLNKCKTLLLGLFEKRINTILEIKNKKIIEKNLPPFDAVQLKTLPNSNISSIFIPIITCKKRTDFNIPK